MALPSVASSSIPRRPKAFATRSFPPLCGPAATSAAAADELPAASGNLISDQKAPLTPLLTPAPEPTSCGPGSDFLSYRGKIFKPPIAFAIRIFPKGCGPKPSDEASIDAARRISEERNDGKDAAKSDRKSSQMLGFGEGGGRFRRAEAYEAKIEVEEMDDVARRIPEEGSRLGKISENALVGKSLGVEDGENSYRKSSLVADFVKDGKRFCRPEGSEAKTKIGKMEEGFNGVVRRIFKEGSGLGKILKKAVVGKSLGGKDGEIANRRSSLMPCVAKDGRKFYRPERLEPNKSKVEGMDEKLNNVVRRISKEGNGLGKVSKTDVVGRSLDEKDGKKANRKRALIPGLAENGRSKGGQLLEVRGDRLIVQALMAAKWCPWMQGKGRGSLGLQSRQKKPRISASGNSNKS